MHRQVKDAASQVRVGFLVPSSIAHSLLGSFIHSLTQQIPAPVHTTPCWRPWEGLVRHRISTGSHTSILPEPTLSWWETDLQIKGKKKVVSATCGEGTQEFDRTEAVEVAS